jgi:hypothetical protein
MTAATAPTETAADPLPEEALPEDRFLNRELS